MNAGIHVDAGIQAAIICRAVSPWISQTIVAAALPPANSMATNAPLSHLRTGERLCVTRRSPAAARTAVSTDGAAMGVSGAASNFGSGRFVTSGANDGAS